MAQALAMTEPIPSPDEAVAPTTESSLAVKPEPAVKDGEARRGAAADRQNWVVQYVFQDETGRTKLTIITVVAPSYESAKAYAVKHAPGKEFVLSVHPESGEQFLGQVRHKAWALSGK